MDAHFYEVYAGIQATSPGFRTARIEPYLPEDIDWVRASQQTPCGRIASEWRRQEDELQLDVEIPVGTTATVVVPAPEGVETTLTIEGQPVRDLLAAPPVTRVERTAESVTFTVESGRCRFSTTPAPTPGGG